MTVPNTYLIVEEAKVRQLQLRQEAERHNLHQPASGDRNGRLRRGRQWFGQTLIAAGERLYAEERRPGRNPATAHPGHA